MFRRVGPRAALFAALLVMSAPASAHESGGGQLPKDVPAVTDEGTRAKAIGTEVAAAVTKETPSDVVRSLARSRQTLARAHAAHLAGDSAGARRLGVVALGWAEAAQAQQRAAAAERAGAAVEREAQELTLRRDRGSAMLVEAQARRGQLGAQIAEKKKAVEAAKAPPPPKGDTRPKAPPAGAPKAAAPAKKGGGKGGGGGRGKGGGGGKGGGKR